MRRHSLCTLLPLGALMALAGGSGCSSQGDFGPEEDAFGEATDALVTCTTFMRGGAGAVEDAFVAYDPIAPWRANQNFGALGTIQAGVVATQSRLGLVQFDLSSIPAGATIQSASLSLMKQGSSGPGALSIYEITGGGWTEGSVTYNNFGTLGALAASAVPLSTPAGGALSADLTATVSAWYQGTLPNHGVALSMTQLRATFISSEDPNVSSHPALTVCYDVATCSDGVQNGSETGVDCGGSCAPCSYWPRLVGAAQSDFPPYGTSLRDVTVGPSGDVYVAGINGALSADFGGGAHVQSNTGGTESFFARYDATGAFQAAGTTFAAVGTVPGAFDTGDGIAVDAAGNAYLRAYASDYYYVNTGLYVQKFDPLGNSLSRLGSAGTVPTCWATSTCLTDDFGFFSQGIEVDAAGNLTLNADFANGSEIDRYTSTGASIWGAGAAGSGRVYGKMARDSLDNRYITGSFGGSMTGAGTTITATSAFYSTFIVKIDASGNVVWLKGLGGTAWTQGTAIAVDANDDVWLAGACGFASQTGTLTLGAYSFSGFQGREAFLAKLDPAGNVVWANLYSGSGSESVSGLAGDASGQMHVVGQTTTVGLNLGSGPLAAAGAFRAIVDTSGSVVTSMTVPGSIIESTSYAYGPRVAVMPSGDSVVTYVDASGIPAVTVLP